MYRIYSTYGRLMDCIAGKSRALELLAAWPLAAFVVEECGRGDRIVEIKETQVFEEKPA